MNEKLNAILVELRRRLEALYGPRLARLVLYGSRARGDAGLIAWVGRTEAPYG